MADNPEELKSEPSKDDTGEDSHAGCSNDSIVTSISISFVSGADPGFPVGGANPCLGPPTRALFGENVCKNEKIGFS